MAIEYAGYASNRGNQVDWLEAATGLSGAVKAVDQARKQRRAEDQAILSDTESFINSTEQPKSKTLNEFVLKGTDLTKQRALEWNRLLREGSINRQQYQSRMANLNEYWDSLANATKTLDQRISQAIERQQVQPDGTPPPGSQIEAELQAYFGGLSQLADKDIVVGDDGRVMIGKYDPTGKLLSTEDVKYINNPGNIMFNRTDLDGMVTQGVKDWALWQQGRVTDPRLNPRFALDKARLINTITSNPRSIASILVDNTDGEYGVYFTEEDKAAKMESLRAELQQAGLPFDAKVAESKMIKMVQDVNGDYQPVLTETQQKSARDLVDNAIEMRLQRQVEPAPYRGGGGFDASDYRDMLNEEEDNLRGYIASREMWNKGDASGLKSGYKYEVSGTGDNYKIIIRDITKKPSRKEYGKKWNKEEGKYVPKFKEEYPIVKIVKNPEGLAEFAYDGDQNTNIRKYSEGRKTFSNRGLGQSARFARDEVKQTQQKPKIGSIQDGYKYIGGDPSNPKSWKKV